jgi:hypothetical protein
MKWHWVSRLSLFVVLACVANISAQATCKDDAQAQALKKEILYQAEAWQGQGDLDGSKQAALTNKVNQLLQLCPQSSVQERLPIIAGAWQQVWGPYTYRDNSRGIDPHLDPKRIYQVVFKDGYYYNVSPSLDSKGTPKNQTVLLRGEYQVNKLPKDKNVLAIHFTNLRRVEGDPPQGMTYESLPALAEAHQIQQSTVLPSFFVRLFFGGGFLREVYTDEDVRITYGAKKSSFKDSYLYILKRIPL